MKCLERDKLFAYGCHLLEPREEAEARAHLAECAQCREALEEYRELDAVLEEWKPVEPAPWFDARVRQAVQSIGAAQDPSSFFGLAWVRRLVPVLVMVLLVTASLAILRVRTPHPVSPHTVDQAPPQATAPAPTPPEAVQPEAAAGEEELRLYRNLPILEDYDMLAEFDVLSELPKGDTKVAD